MHDNVRFKAELFYMFISLKLNTRMNQIFTKIKLVQMFPESHDTRSRNNVSRKVIQNINYTAREKVFTYISSGNRHN